MERHAYVQQWGTGHEFYKTLSSKDNIACMHIKQTVSERDVKRKRAADVLYNLLHKIFTYERPWAFVTVDNGNTRSSNQKQA